MSTFADMQARARIQERLRQLKADSPRQWGRMSAHQMVCHLTDAFRLATGERAAKPADNLITRNLVRWVALHTNMAWPHGAKTVAEADQEVGGTSPADWARDHAALLEYAEGFGKHIMPSRHPIFGPLTVSEWGTWAYRHCDHHLRQFGL